MRHSFCISDTFSSTTTITATGRAHNETAQPLIVVHDTISPTLTVTVVVRFTIAWSSLDNLSGLREYDIQYKAGLLGQWQGWLTGTLETEADFTGIPDATYYFQVMATDNINNASIWVEVGPITATHFRFQRWGLG